MSRHRGRCRRHRAPSALSRAGLLPGVALLGGCLSIQPQPIDPAVVAAAWQAIDPVSASSAVVDAMHRGGAATAGPNGFDLTDGISLAEAEATALFFNPSLRATRLQIGLAEAEARYARLWQDPELEIDGAYILDEVDEPWVLGAGLAVTIPLSGRPALVQALAEARIDANVAAALGAEWALLTTLRREWVALARLDTRTVLLRRSIAELQQLIELASRLRAAGVLTMVDERLMRIQHRRAEDELHRAQAAYAEQRLVIVAMLGLHPAQAWRLDASLDAPAEGVGEIDLQAVLRHPQLRQVMAAYQLAERKLQVEVRRQYPDLRIGLGGGREDGDSRLLFGLGLVPLPLWNANRSGIASARVERSVAALDIEQAVQELVGRAGRVSRQRVAAEARLAFLEQELVPMIDQQVLDVRRLAGLGQLELFPLVEAMQQAREVRLELLDARVDAINATLETLALAGPPFRGGAADPMRGKE